MSYPSCTSNIFPCSHLDPCVNIRNEIHNLELKLYYCKKDIDAQSQEIHFLENNISMLEKKILFKQAKLKMRNKKFLKLSKDIQDYTIKYKNITEYNALIKKYVEAITKKMMGFSASLDEIDKMLIVDKK